MTNAIPNQTPADQLRAIIARGIARYQALLPEDFRDSAPVVTLPDHARDASELPEPEPNTSAVDEETQRQLCLTCPLPDCAGVESSACPIRIEARRVWRRSRRMEANR